MPSNPAQAAQTAQTAYEERRKTRRRTAPLIQIRCDGELYVPANWSLGGCLISNYEGALRPGRSVLIEFFLNVAHEHDGLSIGAEVLRYDPEHKALALRFDHLDAADIWEFCNTVDEKFSEELIRGMD